MFVHRAPFSEACLANYRPLVGPEVVDRIQRLAEPVRGARVLHINATAIGGGVAELLFSLVPLMRDAGLDVDWYVLDAHERFFDVTKGFHNALQGFAGSWSQEAFQIYWDGCADNARRLARAWRDYDFIIVHDPQPLVLRSLLPHDGIWIWRCHIDLTSPNLEVWNRLAPHLALYDMAVFSAPEYVPSDLEVDHVGIAMPAIDPFRPKNRPIRADDATRVPAEYGVDPLRPYLLQVSRFDPWKDPVGVVEVYRRIKAERPEMQLVYMASMAHDDPEAWRVYEETRAAAGSDPDIHLLALEVPHDQIARNALEVNAMQRGARVILQKSIREGFGLVVTEALWKEKPVVAGDVGGIRYQVRNGWNGYLVSSVDECAERVLELLRDPELSADFGRRGRETVRSSFLMTRLLEEHLVWFNQLTGNRVATATPSAP